jgi:hypothetical protein
MVQSLSDPRLGHIFIVLRQSNGTKDRYDPNRDHQFYQRKTFLFHDPLLILRPL